MSFASLRPRVKYIRTSNSLSPQQRYRHEPGLQIANIFGLELPNIEITRLGG
jgi:hypothetical protein